MPGNGFKCLWLLGHRAAFDEDTLEYLGDSGLLKIGYKERGFRIRTKIGPWEEGTIPHTFGSIHSTASCLWGVLFWATTAIFWLPSEL